MSKCKHKGCTHTCRGGRGYCPTHYYHVKRYGSSGHYRTPQHGMSDKQAYKSWRAMIARCEQPKVGSYALYGGKGIKVCKRWRHSFPNFYKDMGERPEGMSIDRINSNKDYKPSNCRWATASQQQVNRRHPKTRLDYYLDGVRQLFLTSTAL